MSILNALRQRTLRSILFSLNAHVFNLGFCLIAVSYSISAQDCNGIVINISGNTIGLWTAPEDEGPGPWSVQIQAKGAAGGDHVASGNAGGQGAEITATFVVNNGQTILAISGAAGGSGTPDDAGGGGAGSGAVNCGNPADCVNGIILVVAAGGNGGENQGPGLGGSALNGPPGAGGVGASGNGGGGGGGMVSAGTNGTGGNGGGGGSQVSPFNLVPGGVGSDGSNDGGEGMGGGGGGGAGNNSGSGGGAGRSGASGGNSISATSYIHPSGTNIQGLNGASGGGPNPGSVIVTCLGSLPIQLINFNAVVFEGEVRLVWSTASEKNNQGYDIERSTDNRNWTTLGFVPGNGTTTEKSEYTFADNEPFSGINYYRLKQTDNDGSFQHTPIVVADIKANSMQFDIFPNPSADGAMTFRTVSQQEGDAMLEIWDWAGYKVWKETRHIWKGTTIWPVSLPNFPKGTYSVRLLMPDNSTQFEKIMLH